MEKRGQVSFEYLLVISFALIVIMPAIFIVNETWQESEDGIRVKQAEIAATTIIREAEAVHFLGPPSMSTIDVYIPDRLHSILISDNEITFRVQTNHGIDDVTIPSRANISGSIVAKQGTHRLEIEAVNIQTIISE